MNQLNCLNALSFKCMLIQDGGGGGCGLGLQEAHSQEVNGIDFAVKGTHNSGRLSLSGTEMSQLL